MAFKALTLNPNTGQVLAKDSVIIKAKSSGSRKQLCPVYNEQGEQEVDEQGNKLSKYLWVLEFSFAVFSAKNGRLLFDGSSMIEGYNPDKPCEQQIYEAVKKLKFKSSEKDFIVDYAEDESNLKKFQGEKLVVKEEDWYPLFIDVEDI